MPPVSFTSACCWLDAFFSFSVEISAGSLVFGCSFAVTCFSIYDLIWHACCVQFVTLRDHRPIQGDFGAQKGRPWGSRLGFLSILDGFRDHHLTVFG